MSETMVVLRHDGACAPNAPGSEVIIVGVERSGGAAAPCLPPGPLPAGWEEMSNVATGQGGLILPIALRGRAGNFSLPWVPGDRLFLLTHPWSGRVVVEAEGFQPVVLRLHAETTGVVAVDPRDGSTAPCSAEMISAGRFRRAGNNTAPSSATPSATLARPPDGHVQLRATGAKSPSSRGAEVILLRAEPKGFGRAMDLGPACARAGWQCVEELAGGAQRWRGAAKGLAGALTLPAGPGGRLLLLRHPWSGIVEIASGTACLRLDLFSAETRTLEIEIDRLPELCAVLAADRPQAVDGIVSEEAGPSGTADAADHVGTATAGAVAPTAQQPPARVERSERRSHYSRLLQSVDPARPLALYVPRWRGVALSTETLFDQTLPVPLGLEEHPDEIGPDDIAFLADVLLESRVRHFVVSGGDLFNLAIVRAVQDRAPDRRFDLLWHSNFLQMSEPHDWNLLRHWLQALRDGRVTRVGVVKAGLERWFAALDIEAVHIPNVVPLPAGKDRDPRREPGAAMTPAQPCDPPENPLLGLWLSGSSPYRKTPLAALAATTMVPGARLRAAGLDEVARRFVSDAQVPFERLWPGPLPRTMLHRQMRDTDLTLYVTLSECSPMLPLESFSLGVPCLVGPASDLFRDHAALREHLVVERPLSPAAIAEKATGALAARGAILEHYADYHAALSARSRERVDALVA